MVNNSTTTYDVGNPNPGLRDAKQCGEVKPVNGTPTLPLLITGSPGQQLVHLTDQEDDTQVFL